MRKVLVVSAEDSSSMFALEVLRTLKYIDNNYSFFGAGADFLREEMEVIYTPSDLSFVGLEEPYKFLKIFRIYRHLKNLIETADGVILFDYPGINMRLASYARSKKKPVCYYGAPQVWAWWTSRAKKMAKVVDRLVVMFPFEEPIFTNYGVKARFFGHPLCVSLERYRGIEKSDYIVILPGSRNNEVGSLLSIFIETARLIRKRYNARFNFFLIKAKSVEDKFYETIPSWIEIIPFEKRYEYMTRAKYAFTASGTATLELALLGVMSFVAYRVSPLVYAIASRLVKVRYISIVNIIFDSLVFPEFLQERANPNVIFDEFVRYIEGERNFPIEISDNLFNLLYNSEHYRRVAEFFHEVLS